MLPLTVCPLRWINRPKLSTEKRCLFSSGISEKTKFISVDRKAIIYGFNGKKEMAFFEE